MPVKTSGFLCQCGGVTRCTDSRANKNGSVRRRRECVICKTRMTTWELDLGKYHAMIQQLNDLTKQAGKIVRSVGPDW